MTSGAVGSKSFLNVPVEFNRTFRAAPVVLINDTSGSGNTESIVNCKVIVSPGSVTTTGFTARFYNNTGNDISSFVADWIAVYVE